jgi:hypothetical protein
VLSTPRRFVVVPSERQALAKAKRTGAVREYIEELASSQDASRAAERWFYSDWLSASWFVKASAKRKARDVAAGASAASADAAVPADAASPPGVQEEPAYTDSQPRFWSLDNPLVATGAALGAMVLLATITR